MMIKINSNKAVLANDNLTVKQFAFLVLLNSPHPSPVEHSVKRN